MGTGLKKCRPAKRSCLVVALAMLVICKEEVLLAKMVCLRTEEQGRQGGGSPAGIPTVPATRSLHCRGKVNLTPG